MTENGQISLCGNSLQELSYSLSKAAKQCYESNCELKKLAPILQIPAPYEFYFYSINL